jgi:DNA-binding CsgD family transcriptional regulator
MRNSPTLSSEALLRLTDLAYGTLEDMSSWPQFLGALSATLGGTGAVSLQHDLVQQGSVMSYTNLDPDRLTEYQQHYHQVDPWSISPRARRLVVPGAVLTDEMIVQRAEFARTEFFAFVRPQGLSRMIYMALSRDAETASGISIYRAEDDAPFSDVERRFLAALVPHVARVLRLHAEMRRQHAVAGGALQGLEALNCAALIVDVHSRVHALNQTAQLLLDAQNGISQDKEGLRTSSAAVTTTLRDLVRACASVETLTVPRPNEAALVLTRRGGRPPLDVWITPIRDSESGTSKRAVRSMKATGRVLVLVTERSTDVRPRESLLRTLHGLTEREARVAAILATGAGPDDVCAECGYTRETARWYTKQVLNKLGCRTRSELVRLLSRPITSVHE